MGASVLFAVNLLLAATLAGILWRAEKLRSMVVFHAAALVAAVALYTIMVFVSAATEIEPNRIPMRFYVHVVAAATAYLPFLIFLVVTWGRTLGAVAEGGLSATTTKLEDAAQALRFRHTGRAAKVVGEVLEQDPDNVSARTLMGQIHLSRGHYGKAIGSFRLAMTNASDDAEFAQFVFTVAVLLDEHLGDAKGACEELDLIRKRAPGTPQAEKAQRWIVRIMDRAAREE